ncbi:glycogen/starch/alpha-glucan phosphorylase [Pseudoalteromonas tunicata]|jgi:starch phosphorylase|uniref:Alpha-1,4 glucan phosphorylase n=1 Tax=Pseudoalteromonas tunicata D2 TaxID=87626 RepID=A4C4C7_9GAMM|nr:glycogen/starch/alpha-glucan phosphorylase [Pseudoalteromonas tunicata]AXT33217.1 glycogen/starch/alpha-glucan phosphorylase [Pseudoalteromonas tunicata]EAR30409.1 glycogen phosphorylase family protein [Pseudoalteromonas tunicata D2]MDP4982112.1 glycogen/starch/alpha-glucan phosphorylase [Pseudoalteromonas tunicata]
MAHSKNDVCKLKTAHDAPLIDEISLQEDLDRHFYYTLGRDVVGESRLYLYHALALTIRDRLVALCRSTRQMQKANPTRQVAYLSLEFLMGRALGNAVLNLDLEDNVRKALADYCSTFESVAEAEHDAGLGNGGLGRLAACFLDSCATLGLPVTGYGIRYEYGMFNQSIEQGNQVEHPDNWLREGHPWEITAPDHSRRVKFFGHVEIYQDKQGRKHHQWVGTQDVLAVAYDVPVPGYRNDVVNTLRLWKSEATDEFNLSEFNAGSYTEAVARKNLAEQITMVLYPNDSSENGKELRLRQQYFLSSASLQDILASWVSRYDKDFTNFAKFNVFQLNDTHPSIAVAELMRLLIDDYDLEWDSAWAITTSTMAYTNHTLLPEALEKWSVTLFARLLPRLLEIIYEINARFLMEVACRWPGDTDKQCAMSLIEEGSHPQIRMAYLAIVGSFSVNGVAALHTELLTQGLFNDFYQLWPEKFNNKTNGVTPRRWLSHCNPLLADLISEKIGTDWVADFGQIEKIRRYYDNPTFGQQWREVKEHNKQELIDLVRVQCGVEFDASMMFDVQVKRIHEYKRQLLNILHVIYLYERIRKGDTANLTPRCVLLGGKAAPGYFMAKLIIKLFNNVADAINSDPLAKPYLRVAFLPNYNVTAMETICPATDLSEQISTAGKEASGTGNMKFMMNGAITIGTLDGANIEIRDAVGADNFFLFGAKSEELTQIRANYNPNKIIAENQALNEVMSLLESGHFNLFEPGLFQPIIDSIRDSNDQWLVAYDFDSYIKAQQQVELAYQDKEYWTRLSILNTAASGGFSSDRTIKQYSQDIWQLDQ